MICYRKATLEDLEAIWNYNIRMDPDEPRNLRWKESYISRNLSGRAATYVVIADGEPVGEVTLDYFAEAHGHVQTRKVLADGTTTAYITALRIRKEFAGKGYASGLMKYMEAEAKQRGIQRLTIGVEAAESRNLAMYLHWGYDCFRMYLEECGELVLYYSKEL